MPLPPDHLAAARFAQHVLATGTHRKARNLAAAYLDIHRPSLPGPALPARPGTHSATVLAAFHAALPNQPPTKDLAMLVYGANTVKSKRKVVLLCHHLAASGRLLHPAPGVWLLPPSQPSHQSDVAP